MTVITGVEEGIALQHLCLPLHRDQKRDTLFECISRFFLLWLYIERKDNAAFVWISMNDNHFGKAR